MFSRGSGLAAGALELHYPAANAAHSAGTGVVSPVRDDRIFVVTEEQVIEAG